MKQLYYDQNCDSIISILMCSHLFVKLWAVHIINNVLIVFIKKVFEYQIYSVKYKIAKFEYQIFSIMKNKQFLSSYGNVTYSRAGAVQRNVLDNIERLIFKFFELSVF